MGCFFSKEEEEPIRHISRLRSPINEIRSDRHNIERLNYRPASANSGTVASKFRTVNENNIERPKFGQFKCKECGRAWDSRLCWPGKYQICKRCRKPVYPYSQRELRPSDMADPNNKPEHPKELCEKCKQRGHYCNQKVFKPKLYFHSGGGMYKRY